MNPNELKYWDCMYDAVLEDRGTGISLIRGNFFKYQSILQRVLEHSYFDRNILELGCGLALVAINLANIAKFNYIGIDLSKTATDFAREKYGINATYGNATDIPAENEWADYLFAFDFFEHVNPYARNKVYSEIDRVMKPESIVLINNPTVFGQHLEQYDHGFTLEDLHDLCLIARLNVMLLERYQVEVNDGDFREYEWIILKRGLLENLF